jgi:hypothetical protein
MDEIVVGDRAQWPDVVRLWEAERPGWHDWDSSKRLVPELVAERARMIEAGELIPEMPRY